MINSSVPSAPTAPSERILALDALRGFAVLGILIMNIQIFAMIEASYMNPSAYGDLTGINKWVSVLSHLFADGKFLSIFSILFGAGIVLMTSKAEARSGRSAGLHYRRTLWLIVIGLMHAYVFWYGDILVGYGMCALLVFLFRKLSPRWLLPFGVVTVAVSSLPVLRMVDAVLAAGGLPADASGLETECGDYQQGNRCISRRLDGADVASPAHRP